MAKYDVFLSHNSTDKPAVEDLARRLVKEGIQPWLDKWNLIPGEPWQKAIEEALDNCATCAVFVGPSGTGPWQNEEMRAAIDQRVADRVFRVIPVLLPGAKRGKRSQLPTFLVATTWVEFHRALDDEDAFHRLVCGVRGVEPGPSPGCAVHEGECPYRGLRVFDAQHAPFFFGREALTGWLLNELRFPNSSGQSNRFLAITGASGSGKSSLARAGLVAALKRGEIEGSDQWPIAICRPGPNPLESLAVALSPYTRDDPLDLVDKLRQDERRLHIATRLALREAPPEHRLVVLVDQCEEIFTMCHDEELRRALVNNLLYAAGVVQGQTIVLLTLRADFYGKCATYPRLAAALSDHQVLVGPMTDRELRRAIERPSQLTGCEFEAGLVEVLLHDVKDQPGSLPLLQHALLELWEQRRGQRLTYAAYEAIGGVEGALERRAEAAYEQFSEPEKAICKQVFLRLTQPGEGTEDTKRTVPLHELLPAEGKRKLVEGVVRMLTGENTRLITIQGGENLTGERTVFVEVAHESLIRGWSRLKEWIEENRTALHIHRRLTEAAEEWTQKGQDESYLYRGTRLAEAEKWAEAYATNLNKLEKEFLKASVEFRDAIRHSERKRRIWPSALGGLGGGGLGGLIGGMMSYFARNVEHTEVIAVAFGSFLFGALFGLTIALGIALGRSLGKQKRNFSVMGGVLAGMLIGAPLGLFLGKSGALLGIPIGGMYGGGIALGVVIGEKGNGVKQITVRPIIGMLAGTLVGAVIGDIALGALVGFGIAAGIGVVDDHWQTKVA